MTAPWGLGAGRRRPQPRLKAEGECPTFKTIRDSKGPPLVSIVKGDKTLNETNKLGIMVRYNLLRNLRKSLTTSGIKEDF